MDRRTVAETLAESGAEILVVPNGSPYECDKIDERINLPVKRVTENGLPLVYVNQVGGQDELVFDGASFVLNADRKLAAQLPSWAEAVRLTRWTRGGNGELVLRAGRDRHAAGAPRGDLPRDGRWACATTSPRTAFPASSWACRAASIRR